MARQTPPDRLPQLIACATRVFIEQGYRRTQMDDVAAALGVAKGTLYLYVESKEALFDLVLPLLSEGLGPIALPDISGFTLSNFETDKIVTSEDEFLAIYASLAPSGMKRAQMERSAPYLRPLPVAAPAPPPPAWPAAPLRPSPHPAHAEPAPPPPARAGGCAR